MPLHTLISQPRLRWFVPAFAFVFALATQISFAEADVPREPLVVPIVADSQDAAERDSVFAAAEQARASSTPGALSAAAATALWTRLVRPTRPLRDRDVDAWIRGSQRAMSLLAKADYAGAVRVLRTTHELNVGAVVELSEALGNSRAILDNCLLLVRAVLESQSGVDALNQATQCRALVPTIEPTWELHTPAVRTLLERVDHTRKQSSASVELGVESPTPGCKVRVNGVSIGATPARVVDLIPGTYAVQVECSGANSSVAYNVEASTDRSVWVDPTLDSVVRVDPEFSLRYTSEDALAELRAGHLESLKRVLARGVVGASAGVPASGKNALPGAKSGWNSHDRAAGADSVRARGTRLRRTLGALTVVIGAGATATSWGLYLRRTSAGRDFREADAEGSANAGSLAKAWEKQRIPMLALSAGTVALAPGSALLTQQSRNFPKWTWTFAAVGGAVAAYGVYAIVTADTCPRGVVSSGVCVQGTHQVDRGALLVSQGASLLAVPLGIAVAHKRGKRTTVVVSRSTLLVRGSF